MPSRQRAAAVRLAASSAALRSGLRVWPTADVLPWRSWLTREFESRRETLPDGRRLLRPTESWILWRAIARELAQERGLVAATGLAAALPRSLARAADWALHWSGDPSPEAELLGAARASWERRCRGLGAIDASDWSLLRAAPPSQVLAVTGFGRLGTGRAAWLQRRGATLLDRSDQPRTHPLVHAAVDATGEIAAAAAWCRARLESDAAARLLVVVPDMDRLRLRLQRSFARVLESGPERAAGAPAFALEGGQPLAEFALVRTALALLALGGRTLPFADFGALLRSPYLALGPPDAAARLELWLRDHNVTHVDPSCLRRLRPTVARDLGGGPAEIVQRLLDGASDTAGVAAADSWARRHAARLHGAGWPGSAPLGSHELQVRQRFDELLGEFAAAGAGLARLDATAALQWLEALARDTAFDPATDDVPVTISARLDDPVLSYDGIWVCGCDAARWPGPPAPDAFIPLGVQLTAGLPEASAQGQLELAQQALNAWRTCTAELILSYAETEDDAEQAPSGLLRGLEPWREPQSAGVAIAAPAPLESVPDPAGPHWSRGPRVPGGVRALQLQTECPFRAFAELRLDAAPVREPVAGVDARLRGRMLHGALERLWRELQGSLALHELSREQLNERVRAAVAAATAAELTSVGTELPALLLAAEQRRTVALVGALLDAERERKPFRVLEIEAQRVLRLGALELAVRLDRVDHLEDGGVAILDYKSGREEIFKLEADSLRRPQLPCYALAWGGPIAAVAAVYLRRDGVRWRGAADEPGRLPGLQVAAEAGQDWPQLLARWRARLEATLQQFAAGAAAVAPLPGACEHCHLTGFCRIDMPSLLPAGADGEADGT